MVFDLPRARSSELFLLAALALTGIGCVVLGLQSPSAYDVPAFARICAIAAGMAAAGLFYRASGRSEAIAAGLLGAALFILLTLVLSTFNYLLLPLGRPAIDPLLARIDAQLFGYRWPDFVAAVGAVPFISATLSLAYQSTLAQIALVIAALGLTGRLGELDRALYALILSAAGTILFWAAFPSLGPSTLFTLPPQTVAAAHPLVDPAYGAALRDLARHGSPLISPAQIKGLIAFPSFHTILALFAVWYTRRMPWLFYPLLVVDTVMLPGILVHGGHHLVDLFGGAAMLCAAAFAADAIAAAAEAREARRRSAPNAAGADFAAEASLT